MRSVAALAQSSKGQYLTEMAASCTRLLLSKQRLRNLSKTVASTPLSTGWLTIQGLYLPDACDITGVLSNSLRAGNIEAARS